MPTVEEVIGNYMFKGCTGLKYIMMPFPALIFYPDIIMSSSSHTRGPTPPPGSDDPSWPYWQQRIANSGTRDERIFLIKNLYRELTDERDALMETRMELEVLRKYSKDLEEKLERCIQGNSTPCYMPTRESSPTSRSPSPVPAKKSRTNPVSHTDKLLK
jgi:hypothetical protein